MGEPVILGMGDGRGRGGEGADGRGEVRRAG